MMDAPALPPQTDVLVVGAGPVGLATAVALAEWGVDVTIVDRQAAGANTSRAAVVHARTLEVLDTIGVADTLVRQGLAAPAFTIRDRDRRLVDISFDRLPTPFPYVLMLPQWQTEAALLERLHALGREVLRPLVVTGLDAEPSGATARLADGRVVRARYVVGADGMHSAVRDLAGIGFPGDDAAESFALADVRLEDGSAREEVMLFLSREGMLVWAPLPDGSVRVVAAVDDAPEHPDAAYVQSLLDTRGPRTDTPRVAEVVWGSRFRVHHRVAETFRAGPILLAGDAGHVHSPAGGQGMNIGLQDGVALAQALADVLGGAPESRLDAYVSARRPIAVEVVRFARLLTRIATVPRGLRPLRNVLLSALARVPAFRRALAWQLSGLGHRTAEGPRS
jgi:2-polyprenyl-6-methoxyphenol hydroxylase-like FAD-dependent oxidoreductase